MSSIRSCDAGTQLYPFISRYNSSNTKRPLYFARGHTTDRQQKSKHTRKFRACLLWGHSLFLCQYHLLSYLLYLTFSAFVCFYESVCPSLPLTVCLCVSVCLSLHLSPIPFLSQHEFPNIVLPHRIMAQMRGFHNESMTLKGV